MTWQEEKTLNDFMAKIHITAVEHGWWDKERPLEEVIALMHSELSEALEEYRNGKPLIYYPCNAGGVCDDEIKPNSCDSRSYNPENPGAPCSAKSKKPEGIAIGLADVVIRILDFCGHKDIDIAEILMERRAGNDTLTFPELIAECHSLISGAYKFRKFSRPYYFAECVSLIDFWLEENGGNLMEAMKLKHEYNKTRPYRHGGKKC